MDKDRRTFLELSSELTGYSPIDLEGTGLVDEYRKLVEYEVGKNVTDLLYQTARSVLDKKSGEERDRTMHINIMASAILWPICQNLVVLWYRGQWSSMSSIWYKYYARVSPPSKVAPGKTFVPSTQSYTQQLCYKAAGAHPPGANPTGFGTWGLDPVFGDFAKHNRKRQ